mmetsp:Transcript_11376/g.20664  ORF Transcript_11376/g.20664 Transcript_11376/m.20664 type:complete len:93 (-) Transcript_11376:462-740(-)
MCKFQYLSISQTCLPVSAMGEIDCHQFHHLMMVVTSINGSCIEATASASGEALTDIVQLSLACVGRKRIFRCERNFLIAKADDVMPAKNKEP